MPGDKLLQAVVMLFGFENSFCSTIQPEIIGREAIVLLVFSTLLKHKGNVNGTSINYEVIFCADSAGYK